MAKYSLLSQACVEGVLHQAKQNLSKDGFLMPALFVRFQSGEDIIRPLVLPATSEEKVAYFRQIGVFLRTIGGVFEEAVLLSEAWCINARAWPDALQVAPSKHPKRVETITIIGRNQDGSRMVHVVQPFSRGHDNKPVWERPMVVNYNQSDGNGFTSSGLLDYLFA